MVAFVAKYLEILTSAGLVACAGWGVFQQPVRLQARFWHIRPLSRTFARSDGPPGSRHSMWKVVASRPPKRQTGRQESQTMQLHWHGKATALPWIGSTS